VARQLDNVTGLSGELRSFHVVHVQLWQLSAECSTWGFAPAHERRWHDDHATTQSVWPHGDINVIFRNHRSHYTPTATDIELRGQKALGDHLCQEIDAWREKQGLPAFTNADLKTNAKFVVNNPFSEAFSPLVDHIKKLTSDVQSLRSSARGDDDDARQIIADLISNDRSPFTPDDEMALRNMSHATLREMRRKYLKANTSSHTPPVANSQDPAIKAMSAGAHGLAGADFHARAAERKRMSDEYVRRNPIQRRAAPVTNSNDPAVQAMTAHSGGALAHFRKEVK
jgi:hypothetical protein